MYALLTAFERVCAPVKEELPLSSGLIIQLNVASPVKSYPESPLIILDNQLGKRRPAAPERRVWGTKPF